MREKIVLVVLLAMFLAFGILGFTRQQQTVVAASPSASLSAAASSSASPLASSAPSGSASARPQERPLKIHALGWDLLAPGVLAAEPARPRKDGHPAAPRMPFELTNSPSLQALEKALARGGADREGADIAIVPLPEFVASQERLAALNLYVVFVTGFSRGREALIAGRSELGPKMAEAKGEQSWTLAASGQDSSTLLGLFALELGGIPVSKIKLADPSAARLDAVSYMAVDRSREVQGRVLLTSADANKLIPIVAVAPGGFIESNPSQLAAWANLWLEGQARLVMDAPEAARKVAKYPGAPEALSLVRRLGEISPVTLEDNARLFALAGRQPVTLERLVERTWQLWRGAGVLSTPAPARSLVSTVIVTQLAREASERMGPSAAPPAGPPESWGRVPLDKAPALLVERIAADKPDDPQLSAELGFLAGVFSRSPLRFGLRVGQKIDAAKTKKIIDNAVAQYELPPWQLLPAKTPADSKATGAIEVLAIP